MSYGDFLARKALCDVPTGFEPGDLNPMLFDFQRDIVRWALRRGRACLFLDTGLGKTPCQLEWSHHVQAHGGGLVLILAPLAVAQQTCREGVKFGIEVSYVRDESQITGPGVYITNYEMLEHFTPSAFDGVVLDESSILKAFDGKTRTAIIGSFRQTPYRLACTATPAPNDHIELGNHAEFLGTMTRAEMLSMFFVHDGGDTSEWRLKGHARAAFWKWVCSWAVNLRKPSDLGYSDERFVLPALKIHHHVTAADHSTAARAGMLFKVEAKTLEERRAARRASTDDRVAVVARLVNESPDPWLVWCNLNAEGESLARTIGDAVQVAGSDDRDLKADRMLGFAAGKHRVLVSKPSICGFGMNWQHCPNVAFCGLSDSWEQYYQAVRRVWRFGQTREVNCHVVTSELEGAVVENIERKERDAAGMAAEMVTNMAEISSSEIRGTTHNTTPYNPTLEMEVPTWLRAK